METIQALTQIDYFYIFLGFIAILAAWKAIAVLWEGTFGKLGLETKGMRKRREEHELLLQTSKCLKELQEKHDESVKQSIRHDEIIKNDISSLTEIVNGIVDTLNDMQQKENESKLKELKDSLIRYYNKYKDIGEWSQLEKDAFWDLFADYESRGGDGFIHTIVEPVMRGLKEVE